MNKEFLEKFIEARRLDAEALQSLLPPEAKKHLGFIQKESEALLRDCLCRTKPATSQKETCHKKNIKID